MLFYHRTHIGSHCLPYQDRKRPPADSTHFCCLAGKGGTDRPHNNSKSHARPLAAFASSRIYTGPARTGAHCPRTELPESASTSCLCPLPTCMRLALLSSDAARQSLLAISGPQTAAGRLYTLLQPGWKAVAQIVHTVIRIHTFDRLLHSPLPLQIGFFPWHHSHAERTILTIGL